MLFNRIPFNSGVIDEAIFFFPSDGNIKASKTTNQVIKEDPRFAQAKRDCEEEVYAMYYSVIVEEKAWADYLFMKGPVIGLNANILKDFVDFTAASALKDIGIKYQGSAPRTNPIPWFNKHDNPSKKQTALQENESTNYIIGVLSADLNYDDLPNI